MHKFQELFGPAMYKLKKGPAGKCSTNGSGNGYKFYVVLQLLFEYQTAVKLQHLTKHFTVL
jgi:hypothetical protein